MAVPKLKRLIAGFSPWRSGFHPRFVVDKVALGQFLSENFGFPCQFSFYKILHIHLSSGAGTIGQLVAVVPDGFSLTSPHDTKKERLAKIQQAEHFLLSTKLSSAYCLLLDADFFFDPEDEGDVLPRNAR
jgi:hypothetical protein